MATVAFSLLPESYVELSERELDERIAHAKAEKEKAAAEKH